MNPISKMALNTLMLYANILKIFYNSMTNILSRFLEELEREFDTHFTKSRDRIGNLTQAFDAIKIILKSKHLVTIWDPSVSGAGKIDKAILLGLINSLAEPDSTQLSCDHTSDGSTSQGDRDFVSL